MPKLQSLLKQHRLEAYCELFADNKIDLDILPFITEDDLKDMGVPLGDRRRILFLGRKTANKAGQALTKQSDFRPDQLVAGSDQVREETEIRQITVLMADLVGSTPLAEQLYIEDYHELLTQFLDCCTEVVSANGGFPARYMGDAILACFGFPMAAEDDAARAVDAGLRIVEDVLRIQSAAGAALYARVGIATGLALTGDLMIDGAKTLGPATGAIFSVAARLQTLAQPGAVLVDRETRQLLGQKFVCQDLGAKRLKGFTEARSVWQVRSLAPNYTSREDIRKQTSTPFVGRDDELELLRLRWHATSRNGNVILVTGEAGIGKSRLVDAFASQFATQPTDVLWMQCAANESLRPFHPVIRVIEAMSGINKVADRAKKRDCLTAWADRELQLPPVPTSALTRLLSLSEDDASQSGKTPPGEFKKEIFETLLRVFEHLGQNSPLLAVLEDIHWIDPTTEEFLDFLVRRISPIKVLLICTYRPDYHPRLLGEPRVSLINMSRLDHAESIELINQVRGEYPLSSEMIQEIITKTDGVPLFLEELTKSVMETERQAGDNVSDTGAPGGPGDALLPTTLLGSLLARLDRIPNASKIAPIGAAIGRTFSHALLMCVAGIPANNGQKLATTLAGLTAAGLLTQHGRGPDTIYAFKHALVQEAAYEILPKSRRVRLHHQIATALELLADESKDIRPETLAHHFFLAEEYYKACEHWWRAAIEARQNSADTEAVAFIHAALDANSRLPESNASRDREIELREDLYVPLQVTSWGSPEIAQNVERLRELRMQRGDREELLDILHALSGYNIISGRISAARKLAEEILDQYGQNDEVARVLGLRAMGMCSFLSGEPDEAIAEFKQIISLCDHIDLNRMRQFYQADTALIAHCMICWALALKGEREDMTAALAAVEPMIEACSDRWSSAYSLIVLASTHQTAGNVDQCLEFVYRGIPIAEECRSDYWIGWGEVLRGWAVARKGHVSQGSSEITQGLDRYCATGSKQMIPYAKTLLADALLASGQTVEVLEIIDELTFNREPEEVRFVDSMLKKLSRRAKARKKKDNARKA